MSITKLHAANDIREPLRMSAMPPGLYPGIPADVYHARELGVASNTALAKVSEAAAVYRAWVDAGDEEEDKPALAFGRAFHCAACEPDVFQAFYAVEPYFGNCSYKGPKDARESWRKDNAGKIWLSAKDGKTIAGMVAAVHRHPLAGPLVRGGESEVTCRWRDPETGLQCKSRLDIWHANWRTPVDLKSTDDPRPGAFKRSCEVFGYDRQEAFYRGGLAALGAKVDDFAFIAAGKKPPYLVAVYSLAPSSVYEADAQNRQALRTLADCLAKDEWPGLPVAIQQLELRPWRLTK
jgi:hypothetical protein